MSDFLSFRPEDSAEDAEEFYSKKRRRTPFRNRHVNSMQHRIPSQQSDEKLPSHLNNDENDANGMDLDGSGGRLPKSPKVTRIPKTDSTSSSTLTRTMTTTTTTTTKTCSVFISEERNQIHSIPSRYDALMDGSSADLYQATYLDTPHRRVTATGVQLLSNPPHNRTTPRSPPKTALLASLTSSLSPPPASSSSSDHSLSSYVDIDVSSSSATPALSGPVQSDRRGRKLLSSIRPGEVQPNAMRVHGLRNANKTGGEEQDSPSSSSFSDNHSAIIPPHPPSKPSGQSDQVSMPAPPSGPRPSRVRAVRTVIQAKKIDDDGDDDEMEEDVKAAAPPTSTTMGKTFDGPISVPHSVVETAVSSIRSRFQRITLHRGHAGGDSAPIHPHPLIAGPQPPSSVAPPSSSRRSSLLSWRPSKLIADVFKSRSSLIAPTAEARRNQIETFREAAFAALSAISVQDVSDFLALELPSWPSALQATQFVAHALVLLLRLHDMLLQDGGSEWVLLRRMIGQHSPELLVALYQLRFEDVSYDSFSTVVSLLRGAPFTADEMTAMSAVLGHLYAWVTNAARVIVVTNGWEEFADLLA